ncbi:hypothetical protein CDAR_586321 [Caerostris darwini]|uniref:Uncharacterized protein n=1 Tax=Caerostris darwini TaxID=1538125 RepID=A0AAV4QA31_9ARAC|nr:hypothetical protein CDAR_586321 [Caerostris darwini]
MVPAKSSSSSHDQIPCEACPRTDPAPISHIIRILMRLAGVSWVSYSGMPDSKQIKGYNHSNQSPPTRHKETQLYTKRDKKFFQRGLIHQQKILSKYRRKKSIY